MDNILLREVGIRNHLFDGIDGKGLNLKGFQLFLIDEDGNGFASEWIQSQYTYYELISGEYEFRQARIYPDTSFSAVTF